MKRARSSGYRTGDLVDVFFRWTSPNNFPCECAAASPLPVRAARTHGWMGGCVLDDRVSDANIVVRIECHSSMNRRGERTSDELCISVAASDVRPRLLSSETPVLSLLLVRWGGADGVDDEEDHCGAISSSVSDGYIESFLSVVYETLGPRYECVSVFVESSADLSAMEQAQLASMLHGSQRAALYFLWPSRFREGAVTRRNVDGVPLRVGVVNAAASLHAMEAMEAAGVPTRFPHASQLYAALLSKEYQASLCTSAEFALPATTLVNRGAAVRDPSRAAASAVSALAKLRTEGTPPPGMGVVKLGFSWEVPFEGALPAPRFAIERCCRPARARTVRLLRHPWLCVLRPCMCALLLRPCMIVRTFTQAVHVRTFTSTAELAAVLEALACKDGCEAPCLLVQDCASRALQPANLRTGAPGAAAAASFPVALTTLARARAPPVRRGAQRVRDARIPCEGAPRARGLLGLWVGGLRLHGQAVRL
jgi:hypothetical protein